MTKQEKKAIFDRAYKTKKVEDAREEITVINDELPEAEYTAVMNIQHDLNEHTGTFELDYEIMSRASDIIADLTLEDLERADIYELTADSASVYTATRLAYLNIWNQDEISDKLKEFGCDIATACAIWYDEQVAYACELIRNYILQD